MCLRPCDSERRDTTMPRTRSRVCLQDGLRLDLNRLARKGFIKFGANIGMRGIVWNNPYWGEVVGIISADMTDPHDSWLGIQIGESTQRITLVSRSRHFRRTPVVLCLPCDRSDRNGSLEAARSYKVLQPEGLGTTGCVCIAVFGPRQSSPLRAIQNQFAAM